MSKTYIMQFRTPAQQAVHTALKPMDIRGVSRRDINIERFTLQSQPNAKEALAEIRQLLEECEPEGYKITGMNTDLELGKEDGFDMGVSEYSANIEKRLG